MNHHSSRPAIYSGAAAALLCLAALAAYDGLVELTIEPPCYTSRQPSTLFRKTGISSLTISLVDPDGFIAAVEGDGPHED